MFEALPMLSTVRGRMQLAGVRTNGAPVYVEHEGLLYKVQVGDCLSRDEAETLRREAVGLGLEGAFIVDALVNTR